MSTNSESQEVMLRDLQMPTTQQEALNTLVSAVNLAQSRGAYKIGESSQLAAAIALFQPNNKKLASVSEESNEDA
jgi:hypothetical protein